MFTELLPTAIKPVWSGTIGTPGQGATAAPLAPSSDDAPPSTGAESDDELPFPALEEAPELPDAGVPPALVDEGDAAELPGVDAVELPPAPVDPLLLAAGDPPSSSPELCGKAPFCAVLLAQPQSGPAAATAQSAGKSKGKRQDRNGAKKCSLINPARYRAAGFVPPGFSPGFSPQEAPRPRRRVAPQSGGSGWSSIAFRNRSGARKRSSSSVHEASAKGPCWRPRTH